MELILMIVMTRTCQIRRDRDGESKVLTINFFRPKHVGLDKFKATATILCDYFNKEIRTFGSDEVQALFCLFGPLVAYLRKRERDGFAIYWLSEGDLHFSNFWGYRP
jgi:hypothetical protein